MSDAPLPRIAFSRPQTLELGEWPVLPPGYRDLGSEWRVVCAAERRCPPRVAAAVARLWILARILRASRGADAVVAGRYGEYAAIFRGLLHLPRAPFLLVDVERRTLHRGATRGRISRAGHRAIARGATRIGVFAEEEGARYAGAYGIPAAKFVWIPYCTGVDPVAHPTADLGYIFSGGSYDRDWPTFFEAVSDLPVEVRIAAARSTVPAEDVPANVVLLDRVSRSEFHRQIAGARLVVLALRDRELRFPGIRTYVTAMRLGKCVVVNDPRGARSYIRHGDTGILTATADPAALRSAIQEMLDDPVRRAAIAENARRFAAAHFTIEAYFRRIEEVVGLLADPRP